MDENDASLRSLLDAFSDVSEPNDVFDRAAEVFAEFGTGWIGHGIADREALRLYAYSSNFPDVLMASMVRLDVLRDDYLALHCAQTSEILISDVVTDGYPERVALNRILTSQGIAGAVCQPVPARIDGAFAGVTFLVRDRDALDEIKRPEVRERFTLAALLFNAAYEPASIPEPVSANASAAKYFLLTPREKEALTLLAAGHRTDRIAEKMNVSDSAVKKLHALARGKLGAKTMTQAVAMAAAKKIIPL